MISDYFVIAFNNLRFRKLRSWLTILAIFIGVAAVVALISLGQGMQNAINEQFEEIGGDKIIIQTKTLGPPGSATSKSLILTTKDLETIEKVKGVESALGVLVKSSPVEFRDELEVVLVLGFDSEEREDFAKEVSEDIIKGRDLKKGDKSKAVVGYNHVYGNIWEKTVKIGDTLQIEGADFKVIGVIEKKGNPYDDRAITVPKETLKDLLDIEDEESQILVKVERGFDPATVAETIERKLRKERDEEEGEETFIVQTSEQLLKTFTNIFGIVQAILVGIAAISLLVGGIGIMNTMYTSVLERTREIGIMKAIGAKNSSIMLLFLIESGLIGLGGGAIGIILGMALSKTVEVVVTNMGFGLLKIAFTPTLIFGALAFSFVIGCLSGVLPARQAARLKPVDALRYE